ncbi:hypothetical protein [Staphylococcus simulans]
MRTYQQKVYNLWISVYKWVDNCGK